MGLQGTDHGTHLNDGTLYGQYAIYISDKASVFPCEDTNLRITMYDFQSDVEDFDLIDKSKTGFLTYDEIVFSSSDENKDGLLSLPEYSGAREVNDFGKTVTDDDVTIDFERIDRDGDGFLKFREVVFDSADTDKDGTLS